MKTPMFYFSLVCVVVFILCYLVPVGYLVVGFVGLLVLVTGMTFAVLEMSPKRLDRIIKYFGSAGK